MTDPTQTFQRIITSQTTSRVLGSLVTIIMSAYIFKSGHLIGIIGAAAILALLAFCLLYSAYYDFRDRKQPPTHQDNPPRSQRSPIFTNCLLLIIGISLWT